MHYIYIKFGWNRKIKGGIHFILITKEIKEKGRVKAEKFKRKQLYNTNSISSNNNSTANLSSSNN